MTGGDAYDRLKAAILEGELQPNQRLVESDLCSWLDASRSVVRTALVRLAHDGLIEHERNRGARVRMVTEQEAIEVLEARMVLEALAARHAARNATSDDVTALRDVLSGMRTRLDAGDLLAASERNAGLHARILAIANQATINRLVSTLNSQLVRFQYRTILVPGRSERSFAEHSAVVEAIASGDEDGAERAMRTHLAGVADALRSAPAAGAPSPTAVGVPASA